MKTFILITRVALGLIFFVFGLNGFLNFMPMPPVHDAAGVFIGGLIGSGYFFQFLKLCEVIGGLALLSGFFVPLALVILAPININIFLFHLFLEKEGLLMSLAMISLHLFLAWTYRDYYSKLFTVDAKA